MFLQKNGGGCILTIGLIFSSCSKEPVELNEKNLGYPLSAATSPLPENYVQNPLNPHDTSGQRHNSHLIAFFNDVKTDRSSYKLSDVIDYFNFPFSLREFEANYQSRLDSIENQTFPESEYEISPDYYDFVFGLLSIVNSNTKSLTDKINDIKLLETTILSASVNESQRSVMYVAGSIARFSSYFWAHEDEGGLNWASKVHDYGFNSNGNNSPSYGPNWEDVAGDDISGALIGAWFTANPFVALGGGVASSAWSVMDHYWGG